MIARPALWVLVVLVWLLLPWLPGMPLFWVSLLNTVGIASIIGVGLVVLTGIGGMTSFGQASFMGFGAYASALLTKAGLSPWLGLPASVLASLLAAFVIGAATLRLQGHYLALATIAWSVSLYYLFGTRLYFAVIWIALALVVLGTRNLLDSRMGRALRALRGGARASASVGIKIPRVRMLAFLYAAGLAGLAGWLYAHLQRAVNPTPFGLSASIEYLLMVVVGGAAHIGGALLGAAVVTLLQDRLQTWLPLVLHANGNFETIVFGALLVSVLQIAPEGLWPHLGRARDRRRSVPNDASALPQAGQPERGRPVLELCRLGKTFGGLVAVKDVSFVLNGAEMVALIGPNGAGKSTIFDLITGVSRPNAGTVRFIGTRIEALGPSQIAHLRIARSFQHVKLVAGMSVIENVALGAHLRGQCGAVAALLRLDRLEEARLFREAMRALERVGLAEAAGRPAGSLALGQQRIVEIARALCLDPVLMLLDEPAAGLRHNEKQRLASLLRQLRSDGITVLLVEHDMEFVMNLAERLVVMDFGTKLAEGAPATVRNDPAVIEAYLGGVA